MFRSWDIDGAVIPNLPNVMSTGSSFTMMTVVGKRQFVTLKCLVSRHAGDGPFKFFFTVLLFSRMSVFFEYSQKTGFSVACGSRLFVKLEIYGASALADSTEKYSSPVGPVFLTQGSSKCLSTCGY